MERYYLSYFTNNLSAGEPMPTLNRALEVAKELPSDYNYLIMDRFTDDPVAYRNTCTVPLDEYQKILDQLRGM